MLRVLAALAAIALSAGTTAAVPTYSFVAAWGEAGSGDGQFDMPFGVDVGPDGYVYVVDPGNARVQKFTSSGTYVDEWGGVGVGDGRLSVPADVAVDDDGYVYVVEAGNARVQKFTSSGTYVEKWGSFGSEHEQFNNPFGVAVDQHGNVYVADTGNDRIQKFTSSGTFVGTWGGPGTGDGEFDFPTGVAVDEDGYVYVAEQENDRIQKFTSSGTFVGTWGGPGTGDGEFDRPTHLAVDEQGSVYVADWTNSRVQKFTSSGDFLLGWGSYGTGDGEFDGPFGVACDDSRNLYVTESDNDRVQQFFSPVPTIHTRVAGPDRYATAIAASREAFPEGLRTDPEGYKTVVVATGLNWPDALGGASLAGALDAPLLLTRVNELPSAVASEVTRLGATRAIILGGTTAVSESVASALSALPQIVEVERLDGRTRFETADAIAARAAGVLGPAYDGSVFVATGLDFPDALAASPLAAEKGWPILLASASGLTGATKSAMTSMGVTDARILGGSGAVSSDVEDELVATLGSLHVKRLQGATRYETAMAVAFYGAEASGLTWAHAGIATGRDFPDGLAGGVLCGHRRSVLLLTRGDSLETDVLSMLTDRMAEVHEVYYLGGISVVSQAVQDACESGLY